MAGEESDFFQEFLRASASTSSVSIEISLPKQADQRKELTSTIIYYVLYLFHWLSNQHRPHPDEYSLLHTTHYPPYYLPTIQNMTSEEAIDVSVAQDGGIMKTILSSAPDGSLGPPPPGCEVEAHYTGTLASDGSKFDSSLDRGKPFKFTIGAGQVIRGWDEGFASMRVGEKATLAIRSDYGYGSQAMGAKIPANSDLNFDVELLGFKEKERERWEVSRKWRGEARRDHRP
jgi:hypothetical protein